MRAEGAGFFFLIGRCGEGCNFSTKDACELNREMAEAPDADNANAGRGIDAVLAHRAVNGDAAAEQWCGRLAGQRVRNGNDEAGVCTDEVGVSAVTMNAGAFGGGA